MKSIIIAIAILCSLPNQILASTCPPPPVPLRNLVPTSEYILTGRVLSLNKTTEKNYEHITAEFEVHRVLKGKLKTKTISLLMNYRMQLSMDNSSSGHDQVLLFVNQFEEDTSLFIPSSYQSSFKMMDETGVAVYQQRIKELQAINVIKDKQRRDQCTTDWLIDCTDNSYTYWEGAYDLSPNSGYLTFYDYDAEEVKTRVKLTSTQKQRLKKIVLSKTEINYLELALIRLITDGIDAELLGLLVKNLKSTDTNDLYMRLAVMRQIATMTDREDLNGDMERINSLEYDDHYKANGNKIAQDFINKL